MLVVKDQRMVFEHLASSQQLGASSFSNLFALERISKFTICSPLCQGKIGWQPWALAQGERSEKEERPFMGAKERTKGPFLVPQAGVPNTRGFRVWGGGRRVARSAQRQKQSPAQAERPHRRSALFKDQPKRARTPPKSP
jgi:hypothetical protein